MVVGRSCSESGSAVVLEDEEEVSDWGGRDCFETRVYFVLLGWASTSASISRRKDCSSCSACSSRVRRREGAGSGVEEGGEVVFSWAGGDGAADVDQGQPIVVDVRIYVRVVMGR